MLRLRKILLFDYLYICLLIIVGIYLVLTFTLSLKHSKYKDLDKKSEIEGIVTKVKVDGSYLSLEIKLKEKVIGNYYFKTKEEKEKIINKLKLGSTVRLKGEIKEVEKSSMPLIFNYKEYLNKRDIFYVINIENLEIIKDNISIGYKLKNFFYLRMAKLKTAAYLKTFILGDTTDINNEIKQSYQINGISHLFAISGMHITLFTSMLLYILKRLRVREEKRYFIVICFLLFYMYLTNFSVSVMRASIFFILFSLNKIYYFYIKPINIFIITLCIVLLINPYFIFDISFLFSFTISFFLINFSFVINKYNNYFLKLLMVSIVSFLSSVPIVIYNFYQLNFLSIIYNLFFVPLISFIIFPLSLLTFIFPVFDSLLFLLITIMENISLLLSKIDFLIIITSKLNFFIFIIYYVLLLIFLKHDKKVLIIIMLMIICNISKLNRDTYLIMLDVGQGDSILFHSNGKTILVDTGGSYNYFKEEWEIRTNKQSLSSSRTIPLLKALGIRKLDYLILTHGDVDHMGEAINLVNNFKIDNVVFNVGDYNNLELKLINILEKKKVKYHKNIGAIKLNKHKLYFLNTRIYDNENDNSNVIYFNYHNIKMLFMGDAGIIREKAILKKYNISNIDILKVGHHGSNTSSSKDFIDSVNPKNCLISVGKSNKFGHPRESVLDILSDCNIYRTDLNGSIEIKLNKNGYKIKTIN